VSGTSYLLHYLRHVQAAHDHQPRGITQRPEQPLTEVRRRDRLMLVAGPGVHICAECVGLCNEILAQNPVGAAGEDSPGA